MTNKELMECIAAEEAGKKIEWRAACDPNDSWLSKEHEGWMLPSRIYRVAPEPVKKEGKWVRKEIVKDDGQYCLVHPIADVYVIDALPRVPGFGGIDYQSPFDPKVTVSSMVPIAFSRESGVHFSVGIQDDDRPGIPVAAWFWREEE